MNKKHFYAAVILLLFLAIGIQTTRAIDIPTDEGVGTWDEVTRTYTLNQNITIPSGEDGLEITEGDLTLDGAGHSVTSTIPTTIPDPPPNGIMLSGITGVTVKDVTVSGFVIGIRLSSSHGNTLMDNTINDNVWGIYFQSSNDNTVSGNTVLNNSMDGIGLYSAQYTIINGNTIQNNYNGVVIAGQSYYNEVYDNEFNSNTQRQVYVGAGSYHKIYNNNFNGVNTVWQVEVGGGSNNDIYYNNFNGGLVNQIGEFYTHQVYMTGGASQIYNNNFIKNYIYQQVYAEADCFGNVFNLPLPIGGNYWSDWDPPDHPDDNGDGIVDDPRTYWVGNEIDQDDFPWVAINGWENYTPPTPEEAIVQLIDTVADMNLQQGIDNSLDAKLDAALNALDDVNQNNDVAAINSLNALINAVEAQRDNKLTDEQADTLINAATDIITMLGG